MQGKHAKEDAAGEDRCGSSPVQQHLPQPVSPALEGFLGLLTLKNRIRIWVDMTRRTDLLKPLVNLKPDSVTQTCNPNTQAEPGGLP